MSRLNLSWIKNFQVQWLFLAYVFVLSHVNAEEFPADHILDKANIFRDHSEKRKNVVYALENLETKYGYKIFIATYYSVLSSTLQERADELYQAWLKNDNKGLVLVIQLDPVVQGDTIAISYHQDASSQYASSAGIVSSKEWREIVNKMRNGSRGQKEDADRLEAMVTLMEREMALKKTALPLGDFKETNWKSKVILLLVGLVLLMVVFLLLRALLRKVIPAKGVYKFPEVEVGQRLGAPYGGGHVSEVNFNPFYPKR